MTGDEEAMDMEYRQHVQQHVTRLRNCQYSCSVRALCARLPWLSIAPLERPVVPEV
jgi:hypothetical protein